MTKLREEYYTGIIECLVKYGQLSEIEAKSLLEQSKLFDGVGEDDDSIIYHEYPYFWAMNLMYRETNPTWWSDPKLWPPPDEYLYGDNYCKQ